MIERLGGMVTDADGSDIAVYVIDGVAYLGADDNEIKLNASECRRLSNLLRNAMRRVE